MGRFPGKAPQHGDVSFSLAEFWARVFSCARAGHPKGMSLGTLPFFVPTPPRLFAGVEPLLLQSICVLITFFSNVTCPSKLPCFLPRTGGLTLLLLSFFFPDKLFHFQPLAILRRNENRSLLVALLRITATLVPDCRELQARRYSADVLRTISPCFFCSRMVVASAIPPAIG